MGHGNDQKGEGTSEEVALARRETRPALGVTALSTSAGQVLRFIALRDISESEAR